MTPAPAALRRHRAAIAAVAVALLLLFARCATRPAPGPPSPSLPAAIVAGGESFPIGTRVVTWREPGAYDAYAEGKFFTAENPPDGKRRYGRRGNLPAARAAQQSPDDLSLDDLREVVHQFVIHYDVAGSSRQCFKVLHDVRNLSVHFLLDVDGTIYQTLDLREKAQHATIANDGSVGVEIAHPGAYAQPMNAAMAVWYGKDDLGWFQKFPKWMTATGIRTPGFVPRPDRADIVAGEVQGRIYYQVDFTPQQYAALARLCAGLARVFPRLRLDAPRNADGSIVDHVLPPAELRAFDGIVGHFHVQQNKQDPGPAFQWERVLREARALLAQ